MASINYAAREISVKVVYYGPGLSGKTTNLQVIHKKTPQESRSDMVSLATETDRTLFFDFLPLDLGKIKGFSTKFQLYTVPGQVYYNATRKLVLRGVDGVVFVADSGADKIQENLESFQNLEDNLAEYGYKRESIPIILQYNKRDVANALPIEELQKHINKYNLPYGEGIAYKGVGVFDTLKQIGKIVIDHLNKKYSKPGRGAEAAPAPVPTQAPPVQAAPPQQFAPPPMQQQYQAPPQQFAPPPQAQQYQTPAQQFAPPPPPVQQYQAPVQQFAPPPPPVQQYQAPVQQFAPPPPPVQQYQAPVQQAPAAQDPFFVSPIQNNPAAPPAPMPQAPQGANDPFFITPAQQFQQQAPAQAPVPPPQVVADNQFFIQPNAPQMPAPQNAVPFQQSSADAFIIEPAAQQQPAMPPPVQQSSQQGFQQGFDNAFTMEPQAAPAAPAVTPASPTPTGGFDPFEFGTPPQQNAVPPGGRSELDLEIEKYQREIEEKQKMMRAAGAPPDSQEMQSYSNPADQNYYQSQQSHAGQESGVAEYMSADTPSDDEVFFTSVDMNKQKKPVNRPVNPTKMKDQKGFINKFFNKE